MGISVLEPLHVRAHLLGEGRLQLRASGRTRPAPRPGRAATSSARGSRAGTPPGSPGPRRARARRGWTTAITSCDAVPGRAGSGMGLSAVFPAFSVSKYANGSCHAIREHGELHLECVSRLVGLALHVHAHGERLRLGHVRVLHLDGRDERHGLVELQLHGLAERLRPPPGPRAGCSPRPARRCPRPRGPRRRPRTCRPGARSAAAAAAPAPAAAP